MTPPSPRFCQCNHHNPHIRNEPSPRKGAFSHLRVYFSKASHIVNESWGFASRNCEGLIPRQFVLFARTPSFPLRGRTIAFSQHTEVLRFLAPPGGCRFPTHLPLAAEAPAACCAIRFAETRFTGYVTSEAMRNVLRTIEESPYAENSKKKQCEYLETF